MKKTYRISPDGPARPTDAEIERYRDPQRLLFNYQKAKGLLHRRPLYKDPKAFIALVLIVLLAWFISDVLDKRPAASPAPVQERPVVP